MKKLLKRLLCLMLSVLVLSSITAGSELSASAQTSGSFEYTVLYDGTAEITGYTGSEAALIIPSEIEGYTVTSIGDSAFNYCDSLTEVTIPDNVTSIGTYAFEDCDSLTNINVDSNNSNYSSLYGVLFNKDQTKLIQYPKGKKETIYVIPDSVISIENQAFEGCVSLTSVIIGNGVTSIGDRAFSGCNSLTEITITDSVTSIGKWAFWLCENLISVTIGNGVTSIGDSAFYECYSLTEISIPDSVTSIGNSVFYDCGRLTKVTIGNGVTSIGNSMFYNCGRLTKITIGSSVTSIEYQAFLSCDSLTEITIPNSVSSITAMAFSGCDSLTDVYYYGTEEEWNNISVGNYNDELFNATIHFEMESTPANPAFEYIVLEDGTAEITGYTGSAAELVIPSEIDGYAVTSIMESALYDCTSLTSVTIPSSITDIGYQAFGHCMNLTEINVEDGNEKYCSVDGVLFSKDKKTIVSYPAGKTQTTYSIPENVDSIDRYAFRDNAYLESVSVPDGVTSIGTSAFESCTSLSDISLPESIVSVGVDAIYNTAYFNDDSNWEDDVLYVDNVLFLALDSIHGKYEIKDGTTVIVGSAFDNCNYLTDVVIPDSVTGIPGGMFVSCKGLQSVTIPETVTEIGTSAFAECSSLTDIYFGGSENQWNRITVATSNEVLNNITIHFDKESLFETEDAETGITVSEEVSETLPDDTHLVVEQVSDISNSVTYDITLEKGGEQIQPNGSVTVKIPVPEGMDGNACKVYRQETDYTYTDMNAIYQDGYMVFTTDHFSRYILTTGDPSDLEVMLGDVTGEGIVDAADAVMIQRYDAGLIDLTARQLQSADVTGDGTVDAADAARIQRYDAGLLLQL